MDAAFRATRNCPCALPRAAGQQPRRDSNDGEHHYHQYGGGEQLDQLQHGSVPPIAGAWTECAPHQHRLHHRRVAGGLVEPWPHCRPGRGGDHEEGF